MIGTAVPNGGDQVMDGSRSAPNGGDQVMSEAAPNGGDQVMSKAAPNGGDQVMDGSRWMASRRSLLQQLAK